MFLQSATPQLAMNEKKRRREAGVVGVVSQTADYTIVRPFRVK